MFYINAGHACQFCEINLSSTNLARILEVTDVLPACDSAVFSVLGRRHVSGFDSAAKPVLCVFLLKSYQDQRMIILKSSTMKAVSECERVSARARAR